MISGAGLLEEVPGEVRMETGSRQESVGAGVMATPLRRGVGSGDRQCAGHSGRA